MRIYGVLLAAMLAACAGARNEACPGGVCGDGGSGGDAASAIDAKADAPLKGFGQPCSDLSQCASNECLVISTGGICTEGCTGDSCPTGYGCFGVNTDELGTQNLCVPLTTQLCTPCTADTECTNIGMDKCVTEATGRAYCAQDCSSVSCPTGYSCNNVVIDSTNYKECVPDSGACDCQTAAEAGGSDACDITTTFNSQCAGTRLCGGTTGWSTCMPPSQTDVPDANYTDDNCDGIDGDITKGIFVSPAGADSATCGLTYMTACQTISEGVIRGVQASRPNVYVQAGTYNEVIVMQSGVNIWGGYDINWVRGPTTDAAHRATVIGKQDVTTGGDHEWLTVRARGLIVPATIADLVLQGPDAIGVGGVSGRDGLSSYVVSSKGSSLSLVRVLIIAGNGAAGSAGGSGADASAVGATSTMIGTEGAKGDEGLSECDDSTRGAGGGGAGNSCTASPSSRAMSGGSGGSGGTEDTDCSPFYDPSLTATPGLGGASASYVNGTAGTGGGGGAGASTCGSGNAGHGGAIVDGSSGGATASGYLDATSSVYWYAHAGGDGSTGENGGGGGGGGGAGGCDSGEDSYGAGGGGGGAGGCAARGGGSGGGGGGGSFGIVATGSSTITLSSCSITQGTAGHGGNGGTGGRGQSGGAGGIPNPTHNGGGAAGAGGAGAHGGHGGGGGGGFGGRSIGVLSTTDTTITGSCAAAGGSAGIGGTGGASATGAPAGEQDGNAGTSGGSGTVEPTRVCGSTASC